MAYSTFRKFVNNRFPLINFKNETLENKPKKETLLYGKNETLVSILLFHSPFHTSLSQIFSFLFFSFSFVFKKEFFFSHLFQYVIFFYLYVFILFIFFSISFLYTPSNLSFFIFFYCLFYLSFVLFSLIF